MNRFFVKENDQNEEKILLSDKEDIKHIIKVLRYKKGDKCEIAVLNKCVYLAELIHITEEYLEFKILDKLNKSYESKININLYQGLPKSDKMDLIVQKNTELGINSVIPVIFKRCVSNFKNKKNELKKIQRWQKIAFSAAKQSKRIKIPTVEEGINFDNLIEKLKMYDLVILAYENNEDTTLKKVLLKNKTAVNIAIIIGPEGGLETREVERLSELCNLRIITLGNRILRTETAGFVITSIIQYELGDI